MVLYLSLYIVLYVSLSLIEMVLYVSLEPRHTTNLCLYIAQTFA